MYVRLKSLLDVMKKSDVSTCVFLFTFRRFDLETAGSANIHYFPTCHGISFLTIISKKLKRKIKLKAQTFCLRIFKFLT